MIQSTLHSRNQAYIDQNQNAIDNIESNRSDSLRMLIEAHQLIRQLKFQNEELKNQSERQNNKIIEELNSIISDLELANQKKDQKLITLERINDQMVSNLVKMEKQIQQLKQMNKKLMKEAENMGSQEWKLNQQKSNSKIMSKDLSKQTISAENQDRSYHFTGSFINEAKKLVSQQQRLIAKRQSSVSLLMNQRFLNSQSIKSQNHQHRSSMKKSASVTTFDSIQKYVSPFEHFKDKIKDISNRFTNTLSKCKENQSFSGIQQQNRRGSSMIKKNSFSLNKSSHREPFSLVSCQNFVEKFEKDLNSTKNSIWKSSNQSQARSSFKTDIFTKTKQKILCL